MRMLDLKANKVSSSLFLFSQKDKPKMYPPPLLLLREGRETESIFAFFNIIRFYDFIRN